MLRQDGILEELVRRLQVLTQCGPRCRFLKQKEDTYYICTCCTKFGTSSY